MLKATALLLVLSLLVSTSASSWQMECRFCRLSASVLLQERSSWSHRGTIWLVEHFCSAFHIATPRVCRGMVEAVGYRLFHIFSITNVTLQPDDICGMVLGPSCATSSPRLTNWTLHIPDLDFPPLASPPLPPPPGSPTLKVLHLSDLHMQLDYLVGSAATCSEPTCCLPTQLPGPGQPSARYWGEYTCDLAPWTLDSIVASAAETHSDAAYIMLTGDYPAHDVWKQSRLNNTRNIAMVAKILKKHFPNTPVLPTIGNHEAFPVNMFPDPSTVGRDSPSWLYGSMAKYFRHWLPDPQVQKTLSRGGYYSLVMKPGLRIIAVNSNFCNNANFWLLPRFSDPDDHLTWLYTELAAAEKKLERVHIISHIPPGTDSCLAGWSRQYNRIIARFRNTVTAQFFGHTHYDEFEVFYANINKSVDTLEPVSVGYIAPSLSPRSGLNPAYRVYYTDSVRSNASHIIMDHATYMLDLEKANTNGLKVELEYTAKHNLNLTDLSPKSWSEFVHSLWTDVEVWEKFYWRYSRGGPSARQECGEKCRRQIIHGLNTSDSSSQIKG